MHISNNLTQLIISKENVKTFIDWFNKDLINTREFPQAFNEGVLIIKSDELFHFNEISMFEYKNISKYKKLSEDIRRINDSFSIIYVFFKFDIFIQTEIKNKNGETLAMYNINPISIEDYFKSPVPYCFKWDTRNENELIANTTNNQFSRDVADIAIPLLCCALWYVTINNKKRYIYNSKSIEHENKKIAKFHKKTTLSKNIYDLGVMKTIRVDKLIKRRQGFTYSHEFQVHGHYRHYKNGKTIFIKPFTKGKGKERSKIITLNPKA